MTEFGVQPSREGVLLFDDVLREERYCIDSLHAQRHPDGQGGQRFSLAFSGGGIRAAAFQAGVLWRLAQANRLKDVDYFAAVSGGGYITSAFASHCLGADLPEAGGVQQWYLDVVGRTICRMQHNAGDFVRDFLLPREEDYDKGSGLFPRILDLPILLFSLLVTLLVNPVVFLVALLIPITVVVDTYFGAGMRYTVCGAHSGWHQGLRALIRWSPIDTLAYVFVGLVVLTLVTWTISHALPNCRRPQKKSGQKRPPATLGYLVGHACTGFLLRFTVAILVIIVYVCMVPAMHWIPYSGSSPVLAEGCKAYIAAASQGQRACTDFYKGRLWYEHITIAESQNTTQANSDEALQEYQVFRGMFVGLLGVLASALAISICIMPLLGPSTFVTILQAAGPLMLFGFASTFTQYSVFGPLSHFRLAAWQYDDDGWVRFVSRCLLLAMVLLPFYEDLRSLLHTYYKRCLKQNFFCNGKDASFTQAAKHPYCPFVILTGTSSDFQPPGDEDTISELSFTPLHTGSEETGYVQMPTWRTLSKCTALTGAGCLDAISLSMSQAVSMRFWLEVLNLSWGDFILFEPYRIKCFDILSKRVGKYAGHVNRFLHRLPCSLCCLVLLLLFVVAWEASHAPGVTAADCAAAKTKLSSALIGVVALLALGFCSNMPGLSLFALCSLVRQFQQVTKFYYVGKAPPRMLYVTDGGVRDCTAIVQLLRRRSRRILLVLAAADPRDELGVLRTALEVAKEERLASFYDPNDPRRDLQVTLELFKEDKSAPYLHIGICYCWDEVGDIDHKTSVGDLYVVKNRLPPEFEGRPVPKLISEGEVTDSPGGWDGEDPGDFDLAADELGPFGCCDCCHQNGLNCGPKFPHGGFTGYLYLSPQWFNNLARLGFELSKEVVVALSKGDQQPDNLPPLRPYSRKANQSGSLCCPSSGYGSDSDNDSQSSGES